jgi:hypothetical protein
MEKDQITINGRQMTLVEYALWKKMVGEYDDYFSDMRFENKELKKFLEVEMEMPDGKWDKVTENLPGCDLLNLSLWAIRIKKRMDCDGKCISKKRIIELKKTDDESELKYTIIHEMIHAYESVLFDRYRQLLCFFLRNKMFRHGLTERRFLRLLRADDMWARSYSSTVAHSVLFLLKALELDRRLKLPPGTIHGYGRIEVMKHLRTG